MTHLLFVYGQLKRGMKLHSYLRDEEFLGEDAVRGKLTIKFKLWYWLRRGKQLVPGELYRITDKKLYELDEVESHPFMYERRMTVLDSGQTAWVYFYNF